MNVYVALIDRMWAFGHGLSDGDGVCVDKKALAQRLALIIAVEMQFLDETEVSEVLQQGLLGGLVREVREEKLSSDVG
jgi:hypothetical protein